MSEADIAFQQAVRTIEKSAWRPIQTAPRTPGVDILVYRPNGVKDASIPMIGVDYWSEELGHVWAKSSHGKQPTHWMPLPEPPK